MEVQAGYGLELYHVEVVFIFKGVFIFEVILIFEVSLLSCLEHYINQIIDDRKNHLKKLTLLVSYTIGIHKE